MREEHPIDLLVAAVEGTAPDSIASSLRVLSEQLAGRRHWILGPPEFFDEPGVGAVRSLGLVLSIYTALPPWDEEIDRQIDRAHMEEVKELIGEICRISGEHDVSFVLEYSEEVIGMVEHGQMDESLEVGLIGEWERVLDERDQ
ncbi:hypothetical protein [Dactylosporangium sp. NPDC048998]|uniref:hypothetical protein n=1 Tax=Dactylosporangium sp. NPDC048998 TaxID=3363976 RepID=UPI00371D2A61